MTSRSLDSEPWACGGDSGKWYDPVLGSQEKSGLGDWLYTEFQSKSISKAHMIWNLILQF